MSVKYLTRYLPWALLCILVFTAQARAEDFCASFDPEPQHFRSLYEQGRELGRAICLSAGERQVDGELNRQYAEFAATAAREMERAFAGRGFEQALMAQMRHFEELARNGVNRAVLPVLDSRTLAGSFDGPVIVQFTDWDESAEVPVGSPECQPQGQPGCQELLDSFTVAINQYQKPYSQLSGAQLRDRAAELEQEWGRYFEESRPQTLLDSILTTYMERDYLSQHRLVGPMPRQWFVIHPSLVVENVSAAADGDQIAPALALEWIGVNWWDRQSSPIGYPIGVSLASVYSDRSSADDIGHGLVFHFGNSMSIGVTDHGGDTGVYVTVDVLNLLAEKKQRVNHYQEQLRDIRDRIDSAVSEIP